MGHFQSLEDPSCPVDPHRNDGQPSRDPIMQIPGLNGLMSPLFDRTPSGNNEHGVAVAATSPRAHWSGARPLPAAAAEDVEENADRKVQAIGKTCLEGSPRQKCAFKTSSAPAGDAARPSSHRLRITARQMTLMFDANPTGLSFWVLEPADSHRAARRCASRIIHSPAARRITRPPPRFTTEIRPAR